MSHQPTRTCIVTNEKKPQNELLRIVRVKNEDGSYIIQIDRNHKLYGRGCYITPTLEILEVALKKKAIEYRLKLGRSLSEEEKEALRSELRVVV